MSYRFLSFVVDKTIVQSTTIRFPDPVFDLPDFVPPDFSPKDGEQRLSADTESPQGSGLSAPICYASFRMTTSISF